MPDALILGKALLEGYSSLVINSAYKLDVKETKLHCNVFSRGRVRDGIICKLCSSNVDEDTASRLWLQLQQNTVVQHSHTKHIHT
ncbi:hypothetical protein Tco_0239326, partial [Tanacetum coccineum]